VAGTGWPCDALEIQHMKLLQRFDVSAIACRDEQRPAYDRDTIGFFIAKFVKLEEPKLATV